MPHNFYEVNKMNQEKKYYVTTSNFKNIVLRSEIQIESDIFEIYKKAYDKIDLSSYINYKEAQSIRKSAIFLEQTDELLISLQQKNEEKIQRRKNLESSSNFLFVAGAPKYHIDDTCKTLSNDFANFEVPEEILIRSKEDVKKFREFAIKNRKILTEGKEDLFLQSLKTTFSLQSDISKIVLPNSGRTNFHKPSEIASIDDVTLRIEKLIHEIELLRKTDEGEKVFKNYVFASTKKLISDKNLSDTARELLEIKRHLINSVLQYNAMKNARGDLTFSASLLKLYGFEPCGICCSEFDLTR